MVEGMGRKALFSVSLGVCGVFGVGVLCESTLYCRGPSVALSPVLACGELQEPVQELGVRRRT